MTFIYGFIAGAIVILVGGVLPLYVVILNMEMNEIEKWDREYDFLQDNSKENAED